MDKYRPARRRRTAPPYLPPADPLRVLGRGQGWLAVEKPSGLLSVPGRGPDKAECAVSRAEAGQGGPLYPVHRLDMDTSGVLLLATSKAAQRLFFRFFAHHLVEKVYHAILTEPPRQAGESAEAAGSIDLPLRADRYHRPWQQYDPIHGKQATTRWRMLDDADGRARVELRPLTGRTHQLRLHAAHPLGLAAAIAGDRLYGDGAVSAPRLCLHATSIRLPCPHGGAPIELLSPVLF